ncbi:hypothetical protein D187_008538 [Cystobacter fuscus DSM 2262]|uniref:Uncharacterized protein n=1 Tax=Cystobacter fuscus (strain ATCC 25194 / DSM 2262 / NBRC 100088 / M29) TaxID=1242864 RepID=S9PD90_CYSF2|nr:hypothetical protein D187_008538 [Cystobacter fuscus DSM 2262]
MLPGLHSLAGDAPAQVGDPPQGRSPRARLGAQFHGRTCLAPAQHAQRRDGQRHPTQPPSPSPPDAPPGGQVPPVVAPPHEVPFRDPMAPAQTKEGLRSDRRERSDALWPGSTRPSSR